MAPSKVEDLIGQLKFAGLQIYHSILFIYKFILSLPEDFLKI